MVFGLAIGVWIPIVWIPIVGISVLAGMFLMTALASVPWRRFPDPVIAEIKQTPTKMPNQYVVDLELDDGRIVRSVWVGYGRWPAWAGGKTIRERYRPRRVLHASAAAKPPRFWFER
jgi:hypothetical protein